MCHFSCLARCQNTLLFWRRTREGCWPGSAAFSGKAPEPLRTRIKLEVVRPNTPTQQNRTGLGFSHLVLVDRKQQGEVHCSRRTRRSGPVRLVPSCRTEQQKTQTEEESSAGPGLDQTMQRLAAAASAPQEREECVCQVNKKKPTMKTFQNKSLFFYFLPWASMKGGRSCKCVFDNDLSLNKCFSVWQHKMFCFSFIC